MTGNRIKLARMANGLSLQQLSDRMKSRGISFTKTSLFNYEADMTVPNPQLLDIFADALGVNRHFFTHDSPENFSVRLIEDLGSVEARRQEVLAYIQVQLEYLISLVNLSGEKDVFQANNPAPVNVESEEDVTAAADQLRNRWRIGALPIASVCSLLEQNGWFIFELPEFFKWEYISGVEESNNIHFIFFSRNPHLDELRSGLLRELGKHLITCRSSRQEEYLSVFASSLLLPCEAIYKDVGKERTQIDSEELRLLKLKYGLSRLDILKRLSQCGILDTQSYLSAYGHLRQSYYISRSYQHVVPLHFFEEVTRMNLLVRRLLAEDKIPGEEVLDYSIY